MYGMLQVGVVRSPFTETSQIPKGRGAEHEAEGFIELEPEFEQGLTDIEGFSHLYIIWVFHTSEGYDLMGTPQTDARPRRRHLVPPAGNPRGPHRLSPGSRLSRHSGTTLPLGQRHDSHLDLPWTVRLHPAERLRG